jgi:Fe-S cluster biogenesis protein NfuA
MFSDVLHCLAENSRRKGTRKMREEVEKSLGKIREYLKMDGGDVELVDVTDDGVVKVRLTGACAGCPFSAITVQMRVEKTLMEEVPGVTKVENVAALPA